MNDTTEARAEMLAKEAEQCAMREKYWSELSIEEKIERTREMVKRTQREQQAQTEWLSAMQDEIRLLSERFNAHTHGGQNGLAQLPANFSSDGRLNRGWAPTPLKRYAAELQAKCHGDRNVVDPSKVYF